MVRLHFGEMVGESARMQEVYKSIETASTHNTAILIEGETGTGKELVARAIHREAWANHKRFIAVNCTAIPKELFESELFGAERGAFTGATQKRPGKFELANGGTLLLDEIGDMDKDLQAKFLRVLEERVFYRVGGVEEVRLQAKIITSTNQSLINKIKEGEFREDLYFRISEFTIHLPPLRERREDIPLLVDYFLKSSIEGSKGKEYSITQEALSLLMDHDWPGNVRELKNVIHQATIQATGGEITPDDIRIERRKPKEETWILLPPDLSLLEVERIVILKTIELYNGDKKKAAKALRIATSTLYEKLKRFQTT
jgi:two-component system response regulator AtoC